MTYGQAKAQGITYKAWLYQCEQEQEEIEQENRDFDPTELDDPDEEDPRDEEEDIFDRAAAKAVSIEEAAFVQDFGAHMDQYDPDVLCRCSACVEFRKRAAHEVELARAVLHCPEEAELVEAALKSPIARFIESQLAMERRAG